MPSKYETVVKTLFEQHPVGGFQEIVRLGFHALDDNDPVLAKACAEHIIARAKSGSGDLMRAILLMAYVFERSGKGGRSEALMNDVLRGRF